MTKKFKFWCKGTSENHNFNKAGWWTYPNFLLNKYFYGLDIFESPDFEVCQWTGLVDKNGREIYEGDIVRYVQHLFNTNPDNFPVRKKVVGYDSFLGRWNLYQTNAGESEIEVIGNKFDNPEFLVSANIKIS